jgi:hypothetical protein
MVLSLPVEEIPERHVPDMVLPLSEGEAGEK